MTTYTITSGPTKVSTAILRTNCPEGTGKVAVADHFKFFAAFSATDVWTADGWLITSCFECEAGISHQMRKGYEVQQAIIHADEVLFYQQNQVTARHGF